MIDIPIIAAAIGLACVVAFIALIGAALSGAAARGDRLADELAGIKECQGRDEDDDDDDFPTAKPPGVQVHSATSAIRSPEEGRRASA